MKLLSRALLAAAVAVAALSLCGAADAAVVTVGPSLTGTWESEECGFSACAFANDELAGTGANLLSPVTGAVVRFNVVGGETAGTYRLRTMHQVSSAAFLFSRWSEPVASVPSAGIQSFPTLLPIEAGQAIGLSMSETASLGFLKGVGRLSQWATEPPEKGQSLAGSSFPELAGFNAEVQPAPTIASLGTTSGPAAGGTAVTITGTDFENTTGVNFGSASAASFTVESETQLTAVAPANASAASVSVAVTTIAGKAIASQTFGYVAPPAPTPPPAPVSHCVVPNLKGKKLAAAKKALVKTKCKLGTVKKLAGATTKSGKVSKQGAKPGSKLPVGAKVAVTLKPAKPAGKKRGKK
jgi:IPT/TIG domain-containing protein/PASTA domain-containing protein